jgi:hypothetical protein
MGIHEPPLMLPSTLPLKSVPAPGFGIHVIKEISILPPQQINLLSVYSDLRLNVFKLSILRDEKILPKYGLFEGPYHFAILFQHPFV